MNAKPLQRWSIALVMAVGCAACTTEPIKAPPVAPPPVRKVAPVDKPPPIAPQPPPAPTPKEPPSPPPIPKAVEELRRGVQRYDDGEYKEAARHFQRALELGLTVPADQVTAHKHLAFMACVAKRTSACRQEFRKAFEVDPAFDLAPAEAGHPMWGPVFRSVKNEVAKKPKPPPPAKR